MTRSPVEPSWTRTRLRVPREDGRLFSRPPLADATVLTRQNAAALSGSRVNIQGRPLDRLRAWTREQAIAAAGHYTRTLLGDAGAPADPELLVVGGHQPAFFHPGVWIKNFALGDLAQRAGGAALNLVIDNDLTPGSRIRVPGGDPARPLVETLPWDADRPVQPWEEAVVLDQEVFRSFGRRVGEHMACWSIDPIARELWPEAVSQVERSRSLRDALTAARARQERRWGTANLELPLSRLCELDPFLWFAGHLLAQLPRFREVHNQVLSEYRRINRIRSRTHPVADLQAAGEWLEAPFWVWRVGDRQRGRLLARQSGREVCLSDGREEFARLRLAPDMDACCAVEALRELPARGIRLRTRALTTTLFARLCLSDLFVHGIGGAKYDEMTDRIMARFFGLPAPEFLTVSATLHLPLATPHPVGADDERRLRDALRDLRFSPERHLTTGVDPDIDRLLSEKQRLVEEQRAAKSLARLGQSAHVSRTQRRRRAPVNRERHRRLQEVSGRLAECLSDRRAMLEEHLSSVRGQLAANRVLQDREFPFLLYPAEKLRGLMDLVDSKALDVN